MQSSPNTLRQLLFVSLLILAVFFGFYSFQYYQKKITVEQEQILSSLEKFKQHTEDLYKLEFFCDSILLNTKSKSSLFAHKVNYHKAHIFLKNDKSQDGIDLLESIYPQFKSLSEEKYEVLSLILLANAYSGINKDSKAILLGQDALVKAKKIKADSLISQINDILSFLAYKNKNYDRALGYLVANNEINIKNQDSSALASRLNNMAILYKNQGRYEQAKTSLLQAQKIDQKQKNYKGLVSTHINLGRLYQDQFLNNLALESFLEAVRINKVYQIGSSNALLNIADFYSNNKEYSLARNYYIQALKIEKKESVLNSIYNDLLEIAIFQKDNQTALSFQKKSNYSVKKIIEKQQLEKKQALEMQAQLYNEKRQLESKQKYTTLVQVLLVILLVLFVFIFLYFFQKFKSNKLSNEKKRVQLELKVLRSQMNPHFIFNALSAIQNSIMDKNPLQSAQYISHFAQLIRQNFDFTSREKIALNDDIDALENYLKTQQIRFENKFDFHIHLDPKINPKVIEIPPMLLQPFVENAIEHGLKKRTKGGKIDIYIEQKKNKILFRIEDNGEGYFPKVNTKLHATQIIKKRLELLEMGDEKSFSIQNHPTQQGTQVLFSLNL